MSTRDAFESWYSVNAVKFGINSFNDKLKAKDVWQACQAHNAKDIAELAKQAEINEALYRDDITELKENLRRAKSAADAEALEVDSRGKLIAELVEALELMTPIYNQLAWIAVCWNDHNFDANSIYTKINTAFNEAGFKRGEGVEPVNNFVEKLEALIAKHKGQS